MIASIQGRASMKNREPSVIRARKIKAALFHSASSKGVWLYENGQPSMRIINARSYKGALEVKALHDGLWLTEETQTIETPTDTIQGGK
jgi:hypothetical protein